MTDYKYERTILAGLANAAGQSPALTQGAGGNVSIKTKDGRMLIKSSGCRLRDVTPEKGISLVKLESLREIIDLPEPDAAYMSEAVIKSTLPLNGKKEKPSVETCFHAMLGYAVVHQHSVYANFITCCEEGRTLAEKLFPEAVFVPFAAPGPELCMSIRKHAVKPIPDAGILFFQNHGLAVYARTTEKVLEMSRAVNEKIKDYFSLSDFTPDYIVGKYKTDNAVPAEMLSRAGLPEGKILTLDQQLYCNPAVMSGTDVTEDLKEIISVIIWLLEAYSARGLRPSFIQ